MTTVKKRKLVKKKEFKDYLKNKEVIGATLSIIFLLVFLVIFVYLTGWKSKFKVLEIDGGKMNFCCPMRLNFDEEPECGSFDGRFCGGVLKIEVENKTSKDYYACVIVDFYDDQKKFIGQNEVCEEIESEDIVDFEMENPYEYVKDYKINTIRFSSEYMTPITKINESNVYKKEEKNETGDNDYNYTGNVYNLLTLSRSKKNADKFVKAINEYIKDDYNYEYDEYKLLYKKTTSESGHTFYNYISKNGVSFDLIFNNRDNTFHCITVINNDKNDDYGLNFIAIRKGAMYVAGEFDACTNNYDYGSTCYLTVAGTYSRMVEHRNYIIELYADDSIDSIFTILNEKDSQKDS